MRQGYEDTQRVEMRAWLARRLRRDVPDALWDYLVAHHHVSEAEESDVDQREEILLKPAKELLRLHQNMSGSVERGYVCSELPSAPYMPDPAPGDPVWARAHAAAPYLLKRLQRHPVVARWRRKLGAPLSREKAHDLLHSPESTRGSRTASHTRFFFDGSETFSAEVEEDSLLWELHDAADRLPPGPWRTERILWWLISEDSPEVQPLQAEIRLGAWPTCTLTVPASAPVHVAGELHKETKDHAWASAALEGLREEANHARVDNRFASTPSPRRLAVFKFVAERGEFEDGGLVPCSSWRKLMDDWNRRLPDRHQWSYNDVRNFRRDYVAAKEALFGGG